MSAGQIAVRACADLAQCKFGIPSEVEVETVPEIQGKALTPL